jgi:hypothetical protein
MTIGRDARFRHDQMIAVNAIFDATSQLEDVA